RCSCPAGRGGTVGSARSSPLARSMATAVWVRLWGSTPTTITWSPFGCSGRRADRRRTCLGGGFIAKLLLGHAGVPRLAAGDRTQSGQPGATAQYRVSPPPGRGYAGRSTSIPSRPWREGDTNRAVSRGGGRVAIREARFRG